MNRFCELGDRAAYLETLADEQIEFASTVLAKAAEINRNEIELLRSRERP